MLHLVPAPRKSELLYSAIARGGRYMQVPEVGTFMRELVGRRGAIASVGLPGNLDKFLRELPEDRRNQAIDLLIDEHTLFGFPFHPPGAS